MSRNWGQQTSSEKVSDQLEPHLDWKRNYLLGKRYIEAFEQASPVSEYRFSAEKIRMGSNDYPWILWMTRERLKPYFIGSCPLWLHQNHVDFIRQMRAAFPAKRLLNQIIGY